MKILIIDSGVDVEHDLLKKGLVYTYQYNNGIYKKSSDSIDKIGHGTAIFSQFFLAFPYAEYHIINIFANDDEPEIGDLISALQFAYEMLQDLDLIHVSSGCVRCSKKEIDELAMICNKLVYECNIPIVSAFDNEGLISFPAKLESVIGVDWSTGCGKPSDFVFVENSNINVLGTGAKLRLAWKGNTYKYVSGSSFAAPYVSIAILKMRERGVVSLKDVLFELKKESIRIKKLPHSLAIINRCFNIDEAIIFPVNKETKSLISFHKDARFRIRGVYEQRFSGLIGKSVYDIMQIEDKSTLVIEDLNSVNWETSFDTVILGHLENLIRISNIDYWDYFLEKCIKYRKNLVSFDKPPHEILEQFLDSRLKIFSPGFKDRINLESQMGKMYALDTPVVGVIGTGSQQGKFTLQIKLKRLMEKRGYNVGYFSTEPTGALLGADMTYPVGYNSTVDLFGKESIMAVNYMIKEIEYSKEPDIIIIGTQSHTVPHNYGNIGHYPLSTLEVLLGALPDISILVVNPDDDGNYVTRTINAIENYLETKIIAVCIFPIIKNMNYSIRGLKSKVLPDEQLQMAKIKFSGLCGRKAYLLGSREDEETLCDEIIGFFLR